MLSLKNKRLNQREKMNCNKYCTIIEYYNANDITVKFDNGKILKHKTYNSFKKGEIKEIPNKEQSSNRLGEKKIMNCGMKATIIKYNNSKDITVKFTDGYVSKNREYKEFIKGKIQNKNINYIKLNNLVGKKFGRWTVINKCYKKIEEKKIKNKNNGNSNSVIYWNCKCDCGNMGVVSSSNLKNGKSKSCGCLEKEMTSKRNKELKTIYGTLEDEFPEFSKNIINDEDKKKTLGSVWKIKIKCPICGNILYINNRTLFRNGIFCNNCSKNISYPNKFLYKVLSQLYIIETEKTFDWSQRKKYDFYIPELNCIIEANGLQHYKNSSWGKVEKIQENDKYKKDLALKNGIKNYIIIDCRKSNFQFIKNSILNNKDFNLLFDINNIDWNKCTNVNTSKKGNLYNYCNLYNSGFSIKEICKIKNIKEEDIQKYLIKGSLIGLCDYKK